MLNPYKTTTPEELKVSLKSLTDSELEAALAIAPYVEEAPPHLVEGRLVPAIKVEQILRKRSLKHRAKGWISFFLQWVLLPVALAVVGAFLAKLMGLA